MNSQDLREYLTSYAEIQDEVLALQANMKEMKQTIEVMMRAEGVQKFAVDGLASIQIVNDTKVASYDAKALVQLMLDAVQREDIAFVKDLIKAISGFDAAKIDKIVVQMVNDGDVDNANALSMHKSETTRSGSLRLTYVK